MTAGKGNGKAIKEKIYACIKSYIVCNAIYTYKCINL